MRYNEMQTMLPDQLDFVPRERKGHIRRIVFAFVIIIALVFIAGYAPFFKNMEAYTPLIAIFLLGILCFYVAYRNQVNLDLVMSTEYQNMLFTQAFSLGTSFAMIVRRDGTIVHASDGMSDVFPRFDYAQSQALEGVFEQGIVRRTDRERIMGAIHSGSNDRLIFPILNHYQEKKDYIISVEPMTRPSGYSLVRGREYLGQRSGLQLMPDTLRSTSVDKLDHMLATTDVALFTTDSFGRFEYVNPAFERLFGYEIGEILESKLSIHHLVFSMGATTVTEEYSLHEHRGEAVLIQKLGSRMNAHIHQSLIRDNTGKTIGASGTIYSPSVR
jgi:PAS domain S-box-containing protein